jgi:hypothetical protein
LAIGGFPAIEDHGFHHLKGIKEGVRIYHILSESLKLRPFPPIRTIDNEKKAAALEGKCIDEVEGDDDDDDDDDDIDVIEEEGEDADGEAEDVVATVDGYNVVVGDVSAGESSSDDE